MSFLDDIARVHGSEVEYCDPAGDVVEPDDPVKGRRASYASRVWRAFQGFVGNPHRYGMIQGSGEVPKLLTNEIVIHTTMDLPEGAEIRYQGEVYRITGQQQMPMLGEPMFTYPAVMEVRGDGPR